MGFRPPLVGILGILWIFWMSTAESFNISPVPNIIIDRPEQETHTPKNRSSYFGYSINLRHESIMIGAPRDQSTVYNQRNINEPGVIYKCTWSSNVTCHAYSVDKKGNEIVKEKKELKKSNDATEFKSNQMLGATMDGMNSESNSFVTCAPNFVFYRWISTRDETFYDDYQTGACYLVDETVGDQPHNTKRINPLTDLNKQLFYNLKNVPMQVFGMAQQGFSLHVNDEGEIISGSPGIWDGKGSVVTINKNGQTSVPAPTYDSLLRSPLFGYAVTSGKFDKSSDKTYFVASAPRFNNLKGNVFIFDISKIDQTKISFTTYFDKQINTLYKFNVKGFGDYFGYSVLAEDFNNDGRLDLAVSAPSYSDKFDNCDFGAVYIFMNQEPMKGQKLLFKDPILIKGESKLFKGGRFGTALSKIGDINNDGFNDIAISAPFENSGVVYIYLGSSSGLSTKPSQKLISPDSSPNGMFGFGMSRGVDVDKNGYRDLAIGAPNSEKVYVFKTYPVIKIQPFLNSSKRIFSLHDTQVNFIVCFLYNRKVAINFTVEIHYTLSVDLELKRKRRTSFKSDFNETILTIYKTINVTSSNQCMEHVAFINASVSNSSIKAELTYDLSKKVSQKDTEFCKDCVVLKPEDIKPVIYEIPFVEACEHCKADLEVTAKVINITDEFILGTSSFILINYTITNYGDAAYFPKLYIAIPENTRFLNTLGCDVNDLTVMICDLSKRTFLHKNETITISVQFDVTELVGDSLNIQAKVSTITTESSIDNNEVETIITLKEASALQIKGKSSQKNLTIGDNLIEIVPFDYEVFNLGPSNIRNFFVTIIFPISIQNHQNETVNFLDFDNSKISCLNGKKAIEVDWMKDGAEIQQITENLDDDFDVLRSKRQIVDDESLLTDGKDYTTESSYFTSNESQTTTEQEYSAISSDISLNSVIFLNCTSPQNGVCIEAKFLVQSFKPVPNSINIKIDFKFNVSELEKLYNGNQTFIMFETLIEVGSQEANDTITNITQSKINPFVIFIQKPNELWKLILYVSVSTLCGIFVLATLIYTLKRCGFFRREKKQELKRLIRESRVITMNQQRQFLADIAELEKNKDLYNTNLAHADDWKI